MNNHNGQRHGRNHQNNGQRHGNGQGRNQRQEVKSGQPIEVGNKDFVSTVVEVRSADFIAECDGDRAICALSEGRSVAAGDNGPEYRHSSMIELPAVGDKVVVRPVATTASHTGYRAGLWAHKSALDTCENYIRERPTGLPVPPKESPMDKFNRRNGARRLIRGSQNPFPVKSAPQAQTNGTAGHDLLTELTKLVGTDGAPDVMAVA